MKKYIILLLLSYTVPIRAQQDTIPKTKKEKTVVPAGQKKLNMEDLELHLEIRQKELNEDYEE